MRAIAKYIAWIALVVLVAPPLLFLAGTITDLPTVKTLMLAATLLWFAAATIWMWPENNNTNP